MKRFFTILSGVLLCCQQLFAALPEVKETAVNTWEVCFYIDYSRSMREEITAEKIEVARVCYKSWASLLKTWKNKHPELKELSISYHTIFQQKKDGGFWRSERKSERLERIDKSHLPEKEFIGWNYKWFGEPKGDATRFVDWMGYFRKYRPGKRNIVVLITDASFTAQSVAQLNRELAADDAMLVICPLAGKLGAEDPHNVILIAIDRALEDVSSLLLADGKNIQLSSSCDKEGYAREAALALRGVDKKLVKDIAWYVNGKKAAGKNNEFKYNLRDAGKYEIAAAISFFNGTVVLRKENFVVTEPVAALTVAGKPRGYAREVKFVLAGLNKKYVKNISWYVNDEKASGKGYDFSRNFRKSGSYQIAVVTELINGNTIRREVSTEVLPPAAKLRLKYNNEIITKRFEREGRKNVTVVPVMIDVTPAGADGEFELTFNGKPFKVNSRAELLPGTDGKFELLYNGSVVDAVEYVMKKQEISKMDISMVSGSYKGQSKLVIDTRNQNNSIPVTINFAPVGEVVDNFDYDYYIFGSDSKKPLVKGRKGGNSQFTKAFPVGKYLVRVESVENPGRAWNAEFQIVYRPPVYNKPDVTLAILHNGKSKGAGKDFNTMIEAKEDGNAVVELKLAGSRNDIDRCTVYVNGVPQHKGKKDYTFQVGKYSIEVKAQGAVIASGEVEIRALENSFELKCSSAAGEHRGSAVAFDVNAGKDGNAAVKFAMYSKNKALQGSYGVKINGKQIEGQYYAHLWEYKFLENKTYVVEFISGQKTVATATVKVKPYVKPEMPNPIQPEPSKSKPAQTKQIVQIQPPVKPVVKSELVLSVAVGEASGKLNIDNVDVAGLLKLDDISIAVEDGDVATLNVNLTADAAGKKEKYSVTLVKMQEELDAEPIAVAKPEELAAGKAFTRELEAGKYELIITVGKKTVKCTITIEAAERQSQSAAPAWPYIFGGLVVVAAALIFALKFLFGQRKFTITIGEKSKSFNAGLHTIDQAAFLECIHSFKIELITQKSGNSTVYSVIFHVAEGSVEHNDGYVTVTDGKSDEIVISGKEEFKISKYNEAVEVTIETK